MLERQHRRRHLHAARRCQSRLPTIGHDIRSLCGAKFSVVSARRCIEWYGKHQEIRFCGRIFLAFVSMA
ncbi:hypothetical protein IEQ34_007237 [Dendrobium chrysotoxum]|uniref:Uncharacterized protein n=1 Tax=Dendrobium chrysotoxum TaxID=161865 RepID=A0AAV7H791_DENCH|nr:hypothetical protein IEQ34_007237 [Dendrobium chrysotoxum]